MNADTLLNLNTTVDVHPITLEVWLKQVMQGARDEALRPIISYPEPAITLRREVYELIESGRKNELEARGHHVPEWVIAAIERHVEMQDAIGEFSRMVRMTGEQMREAMQGIGDAFKEAFVVGFADFSGSVSWPDTGTKPHTVELSPTEKARLRSRMDLERKRKQGRGKGNRFIPNF